MISSSWYVYNIAIYKLSIEYSVSYQGKKCCLISFLSEPLKKQEREETNKAFFK